MKSALVVASVGLAAALVAGPVAAQTPTTYWTCSYAVPTSKSVGLRMTLVGPAGERVFAQTVYLASFQTADSVPTAFVRAVEYKAAFGDYLAGAGYATTSLTGEPVSSNCTPATTAAEAAAHRADLAASAQGRGLKLSVTPVDVNWKPQAAAPSSLVQKPVAASVASPTSLNLFGAAFEDINAQTAAFLGLVPPKGAVVMSVEAGGQAETVGLKRMDVVVEVAGQPTHTASDMAAIVGRMRPGFKTPLRVWRDQKTVDIFLQVPPGVAAAPTPTRPRLGIATHDYAAGESASPGAPMAGAYVGEVLDGGLAEAAGLRSGDIVVAIAGAEVAGAAELKAAVDRAPAGPVVIRVWRDGAFHDLPVEFGPP